MNRKRYAIFDTHIHLDYLQQETGETLAQLVEQAQQANVQKC